MHPSLPGDRAGRAGVPPVDAPVTDTHEVTKPWWKDPFGIPPWMVRERTRLLRPWEVTMARLYFPLAPIVVFALAIRFGSPGTWPAVLLPIFQWFGTPRQQKDQILGRR